MRNSAQAFIREKVAEHEHTQPKKKKDHLSIPVSHVVGHEDEKNQVTRLKMTLLLLKG
jgi:hypothetical protein